jgi:PAS domain S-box-containing protein
MGRLDSWFRIKISIFGKLLVGIIAIVMLISLIAIVGIKSITQLERASNEILDESIKHAAIQNLKLSFQQILMPANDYLIHGNQIEKSHFERLLKEVKTQIDEYHEFFWDNREKILLFKIESSLNELEAIARDIFQFDNPIRHPEGSVIMEEMDAIANTTIGFMDEVLLAEAAEMKERIQITQATNIRASRLLIIMGLFISFCLVIGGFYYVRAITGPLKQLIQTTKSVSGGNLSIKAEVNTNDEIEYLANSFNSMIGILEKTTISRDYFSGILNRMVDTLIIADATGNIKIVNQAALDLLGYQETEIIGQHIGRVLSQEGHEDYQARMDDTIKLLLNGYHDNVYNTYYTKENIAIPVLFSGSLLYDDNNRISGLICVAYHNTEGCQEGKNNRVNNGESESRFIKTIGDIPLTKRELEIVKLIAEDKSNLEIAEKLFISIRTVETHRKNVMQKLQTKSAISLVHYAVQAGII